MSADDEITAFFMEAALIQAVIHAEKVPPEKSFDNFDDLMAWLDADEPSAPVGSPAPLNAND